jgi:hypothetical protein
MNDIFIRPGVVDAVDVHGRPMPVPLPPACLCETSLDNWDCPIHQPTAWPTTEPGELAPEREERMPPGTQIVIPLALGFFIGAIGALLWS